MPLSLGTAAGTRVYLWSHSSRSLLLCQIRVQCPRCWSTGSPFQEAGNEYHLPFQEFWLRPGKLAWGIFFKHFFPIFLVYKILVPQVIETPIFLSLSNLHFICFLPYLLSEQMLVWVLEPGEGWGMRGVFPPTGQEFPFLFPTFIFPFLFRELELRGVEIHRPGHIFYLFNWVAQQNLIVNKKEICYILFKLHVSWWFFYSPLS